MDLFQQAYETMPVTTLFVLLYALPILSVIALFKLTENVSSTSKLDKVTTKVLSLFREKSAARFRQSRGRAGCDYVTSVLCGLGLVEVFHIEFHTKIGNNFNVNSWKCYYAFYHNQKGLLKKLSKDLNRLHTHMPENSYDYMYVWRAGYLLISLDVLKHYGFQYPNHSSKG